MTTINVKCVDNSLIMVSSPVVASGGQNAVQIEFDFCQSWEGYGKTAVFFREKTSCDCKTNEVYNVVISDNKALVPNEVLKEKGRFFFGVYGVNEEGTIKTTNRFKCDVVEGSFVEGIEPEDPTPTMYEQILGAYGSAMTRVDEAETTLEGKTEEFAGHIEKINELDNLIKVHNITISREEILDEVGETITGYQALVEAILLIYGAEIFNNGLVYVQYENDEQEADKCLILRIRDNTYHITDFVNVCYYHRLNKELKVYSLDYWIEVLNQRTSKTMYEHKVMLKKKSSTNSEEARVYLTITNNSASEITLDTLSNYITTTGTSATGFIVHSGSYGVSGAKVGTIYHINTYGSVYQVSYIFDGAVSNDYKEYSNFDTIQDVVRQIY